MPPTVSGSPASSTALRATFMPCSPSGNAQPITASSIAFGSSDGTWATAARIAATSRSSGRTVRSAPRGALPTGVRVAATTNASSRSCNMTGASSVTHRLAGLQHPHHPLLRLRMCNQLEEVLPLQIQQPLLVDHRSGLDIAAGQHIGDRAGDQEIVFADEAAFLQVHQLSLDGGGAAAPGNRERSEEHTSQL